MSEDLSAEYLSMFCNRERAQSFGSIAEQYDRARPPYPDALIVELLARGPTDALDVGCGTGIAARLFADRGLTVLGVEANGGMAEVARAHGLDVEVAPFETWDDRGRRFDLVLSAQAWHWVDPVAGAQRVRQVLRPGGTLALFWNMHELDETVRAALDVVYAQHAPELTSSAARHEGRPGRGPVYAVPLTEAGFLDITVRDFPWERRYSRDEWLDLIVTYSDHQLLPRPQRDALLAAVGEVVDSTGGSITAHYGTHAVLARVPA